MPHAGRGSKNRQRYMFQTYLPIDWRVLVCGSKLEIKFNWVCIGLLFLLSPRSLSILSPVFIRFSGFLWDFSLALEITFSLVKRVHYGRVFGKMYNARALFLSWPFVRSAKYIHKRMHTPHTQPHGRWNIAEISFFFSFVISWQVFCRYPLYSRLGFTVHWIWYFLFAALECECFRVKSFSFITLA